MHKRREWQDVYSLFVTHFIEINVLKNKNEVPYKNEYFEISLRSWDTPSGMTAGKIIEDIVLCSVAQSCLTLCGPMGSSLPGSSAYGSLKARILKWGAISFLGNLPNLRIKLVSLSPELVGGFFTTIATSEDSKYNKHFKKVRLSNVKWLV